MTESDVSSVRQAPTVAQEARVDLIPSRVADVAGVPVRRALPQRVRRTVGAWCFLDHMGPLEVGPDAGAEIGPHPHMGLQTVTWLIAGEFVHRDSLGSQQLIRPGQLNLMTAGRGVSHAEESTGSYHGPLQGVQLWVAQPESTRHGSAAFDHHSDLPHVHLERGIATVLVGSLGPATSPARMDTDHVGVDLALEAGTSVLDLDPVYEHAIVVLEGAVQVGTQEVRRGNLAYLGLGRHELALTAARPARAMVIGGVPFPEPLLMWWNFVGRTRDEITAAYQDWQAADSRFGEVASTLDRIPASPPAWLTGPTP